MCANKRIGWVWHGYEKSTWVDMWEHMSWHAESDLNRWYNVMQSPDKPKTPRIWTLTVQTNSWTASLPHNSTQLMIYIHLFTFGAKPSIFTTPVTSVNQDHLHSVIQCDFIWSNAGLHTTQCLNSTGSACPVAVGHRGCIRAGDAQRTSLGSPGQVLPLYQRGSVTWAWPL